jgi:hypothetical protein
LCRQASCLHKLLMPTLFVPPCLVHRVVILALIFYLFLHKLHNNSPFPKTTSWTRKMLKCRPNILFQTSLIIFTLFKIYYK